MLSPGRPSLKLWLGMQAPLRAVAGQGHLRSIPQVNHTVSSLPWVPASVDYALSSSKEWTPLPLPTSPGVKCPQTEAAAQAFTKWETINNSQGRRFKEELEKKMSRIYENITHSPRTRSMSSHFIEKRQETVEDFKAAIIKLLK